MTNPNHMSKDLVILAIEKDMVLADQIANDLGKSFVRTQVVVLQEGVLNQWLQTAETNIFLVVLHEKSDNISSEIFIPNKAVIQAFQGTFKRIIYAISFDFEPKKIPSLLIYEDFLDFRQAHYMDSIRTIVDLIKPEKRIRKENLRQLGNPQDSSEETIEYLRQNVLYTNDQGIQKAAMRGLEKIGGPKAAKILTERLLNLWGCGALDRAVKALNNLIEEGGCFGLTATLFIDSRYFYEKLRYVLSYIHAMDKDDVIIRNYLLLILYSNIFTVRELIPNLLEILGSSSIDDIRYGSVFARLTLIKVQWAGKAPLPTKEEFIAAVHYVERNYPEFPSLYNSDFPYFSWISDYF